MDPSIPIINFLYKIVLFIFLKKTIRTTKINMLSYNYYFPIFIKYICHITIYNLIEKNKLKIKL